MENRDSTSAIALVSLGPKVYGCSIPAIRLFLHKYRVYPSILHCSNNDLRYHLTSIVEYLVNRFHYDSSEDAIVRMCHQRTKKLFIENRLIDLGQGMMIEFPACEFESNVINVNKLTADHNDEYFVVDDGPKILFLPKHDALAEELFNEFLKLTVYTSTSCKLELVCRNQNGFYLSGIKIKKPLITDLALHYGEKFVPIHDRIINSLNEKEGKGIVLLHGVPGSGKTHYIRYLIQEIKDKTLIYIPPDMAKEISSPQFLPFLMEYPDSILIIEDAENIIKDRNETLNPNQAVANLLNLYVFYSLFNHLFLFNICLHLGPMVF